MKMNKEEENSFDYRINFSIRMAPSEFYDEDQEDLNLLLKISEKDKFLEEFVNDLNRGQEIGFNGTIIGLSDGLKTTSIQVLQIWKENGVLPLKPLVSRIGRYNDADKFLGK